MINIKPEHKRVVHTSHFKSLKIRVLFKGRNGVIFCTQKVKRLKSKSDNRLCSLAVYFQQTISRLLLQVFFLFCYF